MNNRKYNFWRLLQKNKINIPQIQRDFAYGRKSAEKVRISLLSAIKDAVVDCKNENQVVLDFVYGSISANKSMTPLDGQQRLTTLFLLHYYAALKAEAKEKEELLKFSYETRHSANEFCKSLINHYIVDLESNIPLSSQIINQPKYLNSFDDDPTIQSMLVVLDNIHLEFYEVENLWEKLIYEDRVVFYYLDLEELHLTDDLYIKMNSRGKSLTRYEIFKSSFEKYLEDNFPTLKDEISRKLDVDWTNMLWDEGCEIDNGLLNLFRNIFEIYHYLNNSSKTRIEDADKSFLTILKDKDSLEFLISFLDSFHSLIKDNKKGISKYIESYFYYSDEALGRSDLIRVFWNSENVFIRASQGQLIWAELILLYAIYLSLQNEIEEEKLFSRFRKLRNLLINSQDELRPNNIHSMLNETKDLMLYGKVPQSAFNQNQIDEENLEQKINDHNNSLLKYENHSILRGALGLFINSKTDNYESILEKFIQIFNNEYKINTPLIRKAFLSVGDYSQIDTDNRKRFLLHRPEAWRNFFTINQRRKEQEKIISILESIVLSGNVIVDLKKLEELFLSSGNKDWRYYFIKYDDKLHNSYTQGYYFWKNFDENPLEVIMLNSSYESASNLEWNIYNRILFINNRECCSLDDHGASDLIIYRIGISINAFQKGFIVTATNQQNEIIKKLSDDKVITENVYIVPDNQDLIEYGQRLIDTINSYDTNLTNA